MNLKKIPYINLSIQWHEEREDLLPIIEEVMSNGQYVGGKHIEEFEESVKTFCSTKHCVALNSGTDALVCALVACGVKRGDEVITPPNSFIASTSAIVHIGGKPVFADILPDQKLDCVAYGCTSGTIAAGYSSIFEKVNSAKPNTKVTTPITSAINALKSLKINKLSIFTPYTDEINQSVINYFKKENINITELSYFDIASDLDIGKVDPDYLLDVLVKKNLSNSDALFVSCTALPVLSIIKDLEKKTGKVVLSSNQTLIWDTLKQINFKDKVLGYGELFNN